MNNILEALPKKELNVKKVFSFSFDNNFIEIKLINGFIQKIISLEIGFQIIATKLNKIEGMRNDINPIDALLKTNEGLYDVKVIYDDKEIDLENFGVSSNYLTSKEIDEKIIKKLKI